MSLRSGYLKVNFVLSRCDISLSLFIAKLGIIPGAGGTQRTARLIGLSKAKDLIFTARMLTASEALEWGMSSATIGSPILILHTRSR